MAPKKTPTSAAAGGSLLRRIIGRLNRLPMGVREFAFVVPFAGSALFGCFLLDFEKAGIEMNSGTFSSSTLFGSQKDVGHSYDLEPIYDEKGEIKAYRQVIHKPAKSA